MTTLLRLLCVMAHPDDESLGTGGPLVKYASEGVETYLITATRGERGWWGDEKDYPGLEGLGKIREAELLAAAHVLGLREVSLLDYIDGDLDQADPAEAIGTIAAHVRRIRPQVVITFDPYGAYGHPDHIAISQFATAALMVAAHADFVDPEGRAPHVVSKFYYMADPPEWLAAYQAIFGDLVMHVDGIERRATGWPHWAATTRIDADAHWRTVWQAVARHQSQMPGYSRMENLPEAQRRTVWGLRTYYRVFSHVNGGRTVETDLFAGLR